jgi:ABC-type transport system involved in multi-copper enzyme maturation permease subunit
MKRRWAGFGLPLLSKELAEMAQLRRTYAVRVAFAVLIYLTSTLFFLPVYWMLQRTPKGLFGHGAAVLDGVYAIEWGGLALFVPAIVSGALTAEKERNTLQLLFLTKLGPWTILLEKLLSRLVPVATFLLVSLPLLFIAYLLGGLTQTDLGLATVELVLTAFQLASIALFCSAFCATSASAFILSYVLTAFVFLFPFLALLAIFFFNWCSVKIGAGQIGLNFLREYRAAFDALLTSTVGLNLEWVGRGGFGPSGVRPFHTTLPPFVVIPVIGVLFLFLARGVVVRRAAPQPKHRIRRLFAWLDRLFTRLNDRYAKGILLVPPGSGVPEANPVAWRERRRGNLGRVNYLIRILLLLESPILFFSVLSAASSARDVNFTTLGTVGLLLWPIALLIVIVRASGLIAAEKARQTLDVLLTTPLSLSELMGAKMRGLWRVKAIVAVPILFQAFLIAYLRLSAGGRGSWMRERQGFATIGEAAFYEFMIAVNILLLFSLAAELAFLVGLYAKTQGRAVTAVLGLFAAWSFLPLLVRISIDADWARQLLYQSPIADLLVNEFPELGVKWGSARFGDIPDWQYYPLLHCVIFAAIVWALAVVNRRLAAQVLLRPKTQRTQSRHARRMMQLADPSTAM